MRKKGSHARKATLVRSAVTAANCGPNGAVAYLAAERRCIIIITTTTTAVVGKRLPILAKLLMAPHGAIQKGPLQTYQKVESFQWRIFLL
jgi:fructose-specific phosphotransferase system IIC component